MGLRPGYKQTEVGVIPDDWETLPFTTVFKKIPTKRFQITTSDYKTDGLFSVVDQGQVYIVGYTDKIDKLYRVPKDGAIVFGDHTCVVKWIAHDFVVGADGTQILVAKGDQDIAYYAFALAFRPVEPTGYNRHFRFLKERTFVAPPLPEQRAIAGALSDVDAALAGLGRLVAKKRDLKQAAMQQLLTGQTRLPGFGSANGRIKASEVGPIPEDWGTSSLADLVDPARGVRYGIVQPGKYDPNGRFMIRGQDYSESKGWASADQVFRVGPGIEERYKNARVRTGDLIMTIVGYCGHVEIVPSWLDGANLTQTTARLAIKAERADAGFCQAVLNGPVGRQQVANFLKGAAQPGLNCGDVEKFRLPVPSLPEQAAIANILSDIDTEIEALEAQREKMRMLKQAMMQALLTGRVRLPILHDTAPVAAHG